MVMNSIETARTFYERIAAGNMDAFFQLLAEQVVAVSPGRRAHIPWAGTWNGKEGFGEMMTLLGEHADIELYEIDRFVEDGEDRVVVFGRERLRSKATTRVAETSWVHELEVRGGQVFRFVEHYDTDTLAVALAG